LINTPGLTEEDSMMSNSKQIIIEREFEFTQDDFNYLRKIVNERTGIVVVNEKIDMFYSRLARRVRQLGLSDFKQYCDRIKNESDGVEVAQLINAITTNLTSFFREGYHFEYLSNVLIPEMMKTDSQNRKLRIWSAGCSSGEEPYSIAATLNHMELVTDGWDVEILATDIDSNVLDHGTKAVYSMEQLKTVPEQYLQSGFLRGKGGSFGKVRVKPEVRDMVKFAHLNLNSSWSLPEPVDIVFCRNVIIYFDKESKKTLVNRIADNLNPGGYLFIGHSESLFRVNDKFELVGKTIYRKKA
jgi:chemotaxis protein methyltransferase CheR